VGSVVFHPLADEDIDEGFLYIARDSLDAAVRFLVAARQDARKLSDMPGMGPSREFRRAELKGVRFWPISGFRNFLIFYRPLSDGIEVLRVIHGARNVDRVLGDDDVE